MIGNVQEKTIKHFNAPNAEVVSNIAYAYYIIFGVMFVILLLYLQYYSYSINTFKC